MNSLNSEIVILIFDLTRYFCGYIFISKLYTNMYESLFIIPFLQSYFFVSLVFSEDKKAIVMRVTMDYLSYSYVNCFYFFNALIWQ